MSDHIDESVERLAELHRQHQQRSTKAQKLANRLTSALGQPLVVAIVLVVVVVWIVGNLMAPEFHVHSLEEQPFPDLALGLGFVAVLVALLILSTQRHSEALAERRAELTLQIALVSERKIAKVIELLEEQRRDNPLLGSRADDEAERMAAPSDTRESLSRIEETHGQADSS